MTENGDVKSKKARLEDDPFRWPGYTGEVYPELCDIRAMPPQPKESELKPGQLPEKLIRQYFEEVPCIYMYIISGKFPYGNKVFTFVNMKSSIDPCMVECHYSLHMCVHKSILWLCLGHLPY